MNLWRHWIILKTYFVPWGRGWGWGWLQWRWQRPQSALDRTHGSRIRWLEERDFLEIGGRHMNVMWDVLSQLFLAVNLIHLWCWNFPLQVAPEFVCHYTFNMSQYHDDQNDSDDNNDDQWWWWDWNYSWMSNVRPMPRVTRVVASHWMKECILLIFNLFLNFYMVFVPAVSNRNSTILSTEITIFIFTTLLVPFFQFKLFLQNKCQLL